MDNPTLAALLTTAGLAPVVAIIEEALLTAAGPSPEARDRFGPLLALVLGVVIAEVVTVALGLGTKADVAQAALIGILGGSGGIAAHDVVSGASAGP